MSAIARGPGSLSAWAWAARVASAAARSLRMRLAFSSSLAVIAAWELSLATLHPRELEIHLSPLRRIAQAVQEIHVLTFLDQTCRQESIRVGLGR